MLNKNNDDPRSNIYEEQRPWGRFRRLTLNQLSTVKLITVNPGQVLSLQFHNYRDELWVVLTSGLQITVGEKTWQPKPYEEIYIPSKTNHRVEGMGTHPSYWFEISLGKFDEEDIVRLADNYGRK